MRYEAFKKANNTIVLFSRLLIVINKCRSSEKPSESLEYVPRVWEIALTVLPRVWRLKVLGDQLFIVGEADFSVWFLLLVISNNVVRNCSFFTHTITGRHISSETYRHISRLSTLVGEIYSNTEKNLTKITFALRTEFAHLKRRWLPRRFYNAA